MESMEREILKIKTRQKLAAKRGYLKTKGNVYNILPMYVCSIFIDYVKP